MILFELMWLNGNRFKGLYYYFVADWWRKVLYTRWWVDWLIGWLVSFFGQVLWSIKFICLRDLEPTSNHWTDWYKKENAIKLSILPYFQYVITKLKFHIMNRNVFFIVILCTSSCYRLVSGKNTSSHPFCDIRMFLSLNYYESIKYLLFVESNLQINCQDKIVRLYY